MNRLEIHPENSAQGTNSKPNPFVRPILERLTTTGCFALDSKVKLADLGCGKLRHLEICKGFAKHILLVDTKMQIERVQKFAATNYTMSQFVNTVKDSNITIEIMTIDDFEKQERNVDIVLSVAVMDVVLKDARVRMCRAAFRNLRSGGYLVVIVPRNDSSLLVNCKTTNEYEDGFVFRNRGNGPLTFYANFRDPSSLLALLVDNGLKLIEDHSVYRHICWVTQKP